jgi:phage tail sheath protein FI
MQSKSEKDQRLKMPITPTYPGVYIEELPSEGRTITGVSTSITAFLGRALRGPINKAITIFSFAHYVRIFGRLWKESNMSYAVYQYFLNGGKEAIITRVHKNATAAIFERDDSTMRLKASNPGSWGKNLCITVNHDVDKNLEKADTLFNLSIKDTKTGDSENFRNLSVNPEEPRFIKLILSFQSNLVQVDGKVPSTCPPEDDTRKPRFVCKVDSGSDGDPVTTEEIIGDSVSKTGIYALDNIDLFNLLCIPTFDQNDNTNSRISAYNEALGYCEKRRAILLVDPPKEWKNKDKAKKGMETLNLDPNKNATIYFPRIIASDPNEKSKLLEFVPCGAVAGVIARTDQERGIWKAPAGVGATLKGVSGLTVELTDEENRILNSMGINCLRKFPDVGIVVWGARTMKGADGLSSEWKYLPVRRLALYIEESVFRGTKWTVFKPNDEELWSQIRLNVGAFMHNLFTQGAFQGADPNTAYFVKCDSETTTQDDVDRGIVNIVVGFAPLKPAEFVILKIRQIAGEESD